MAQKITQIILNVASDINGMPFKYDWVRGRMEVFRNPMRVAAYKLHALLCLAHVTFEVFQFQDNVEIYMETDMLEFYFNSVAVCAYSFILGLHTHVVLCMNEISNAMNQFHCLIINSFRVKLIIINKY